MKQTLKRANHVVKPQTPSNRILITFLSELLDTKQIGQEIKKIQQTESIENQFYLFF